jgi:hypothetical protein
MSPAPTLRTFVAVLLSVLTSCVTQDDAIVRRDVIRAEQSRPPPPPNAKPSWLTDLDYYQNAAQEFSPVATIRFARELAQRYSLALKDGLESYYQNATAYLDSSAQLAPSDLGNVLLAKALLQKTFGYVEQARASSLLAASALRKSFAEAPMPETAIALVEVTPWTEVQKTCAEVRPRVDGKLFAFLDACVNQAQATSWQVALSWASKADRAFYLKGLQERQTELEAGLRAQRKAQETTWDKLWNAADRGLDRAGTDEVCTTTPTALDPMATESRCRRVESPPPAK